MPFFYYLASLYLLKVYLNPCISKKFIECFLNLLTLSLVIRTIETFNKFLDVAWITSLEKYIRFYQRINLEMVKSLKGFSTSKVRTSPFF